MLLAVAKVARRVEAIGGVLDKALDTQTQRFKDAALELLPDTKGILGASRYGTVEELLAALEGCKADGTEQEIESKEIIKASAVRSKLKLAAGRD